MNAHPRLEGIVVPLITPFNDKGDLAPEKAGPLIGHLSEVGVNGFYVGGSTGEGLLQSIDERRDYLSYVAEVAGTDTILIAQVGAMSTGDAHLLAGHAADCGYHAVSSTPPFYFNYSGAEVLAYYSELAKHSALPVLLYNVPSTTGRSISIDAQIEMLQLPNVIGSKHTDTNLYAAERLIHGVPDTVIFHGADEMLIAGLAMGAAGGIGSTYNLLSRHYVDIYRHVKAGDLENARSSQRLVNDVIFELHKISSGVIPGIKMGLEILGYDIGPPRKPFQKIDVDTSQFERTLTKCNG